MTQDALSDEQWGTLLSRISDGRCTPFLGAGINGSAVPTGASIAQTWATEHHYPLPDTTNLSRVAQYLAILTDPMSPKEDLIKRWLQGVKAPDFAAATEPLGVLASLPFRTFVTTNYDSLLFQALKAAGKAPRRELCRWNVHYRVTNWKSVWDTNPSFVPSVNEPVVFHLHGLDDVHESLVLTEDDYLEYLVAMSKRQLLPDAIQEAFTASSLIFIGYSLADITFRVLFRSLLAMEGAYRKMSVSVQLPDEMAEDEVRARIHVYLSKYFEKNLGVQVFWGTAAQFVAELSARWSARAQGAAIAAVGP